ncbi:MAG: TlpA family protein disulfide reductase [Anaerolineae bacterium]|nr:TlpA family protein disulfide reductase [Anaerolineae bacterium]
METPSSPGQGSRRRLSPTLLAGGLIGILVLALLGYGLTATHASPQVGSPAPEVRLTAFDGTSISLADQRDQVVVINFFASWCSPCREEAAGVQQAWSDYRRRGVQFYGIAYKDAASPAQAFLDEFGVTYPAAIDPGSRTARAYGITGVPETFVIDQQGLLVRHFPGPVTRDQLSQELEKLVRSD